ncbi:MAG: rhomboid family intramembrane serine protease [Gemmataceae bacterium]|nr:rhomboid family intramembrane serine protease [Gemmataceae bacterium]
MGIYDRDYYKTPPTPFLEFGIGGVSICKILIFSNIALFILQLLTREGNPAFSERGQVADWLILIPKLVWEGEIWRVFTYGFLHSVSNPFHIVVNLLVLWFFGKEIENCLGSLEFLLFYCFSVLAGGLVFVLGVSLNIHSSLTPCLGASGGVTAVLILYACWFPSRTVLLFFVIPMPIWALAILFVAMDAFSLLTQNHQGVAVDVHLAGALFAFLYHKLDIHFTRWDLTSWWKKRNQPKLKIYFEEPPPLPMTLENQDTYQGSQVDIILEKISRSGRDSLTAGEKEALLRASEALRKKKPLN